MRSCETNSFASYYLYAIFIFFFVSSLSWLPKVYCDSLVSRSGEAFKVFVPKKTDFKEFVDCTDSANPKGFCIDVFNSAISGLSLKHSWTSVNYTCKDIGDLTYDTLVDDLAASEDYDAVVGDVTVSAKRLANVSFTQTYLDSGLVILSLDRDISQRFPGVFFQPFSNETWALLVGSIFLTGFTLWLLERSNTDLDPIQPSRLGKLAKIFWFVTSILIFLTRDKTKNPLTKFVMMAWILFLILFSSSYTATLSSILTVDVRSQKALTLDDLINMNKPIGFQVGSFAEDYLKEKLKSLQLKALSNVTQYADELRLKNVSAVVDEIPYVSLFLADQPASNCMFSVSQKLTIEGLGFAFYNKSLSDAFTVAILNLSESGQLQRMQDGWKVSYFQCPSRIQSTRLDLTSSQGLFVFLGSALVIVMLYFMLRHVILPKSKRAYERLRRRGDIDEDEDPSSRPSSTRPARATGNDILPFEMH